MSAVDPALFIVVWRIRAQIAFHGLFCYWIPYRAVGNIRTGFYACLATYALLGVNHPNVAVFGADVTGAGGTILHA